MHILAFGASKNIGYLATRRLLEDNHSVTYFLRKPDVFENDANIQKHIQEGRVQIVKGDATIRDDVRKAYEEATSNGRPLDVILFSVGGTPSFSLTQGFLINPPNLCSSSLLNVLACYPETSPGAPQPKLVVISSNGLTDAGHASLPLPIKALFSFGLRRPHADKLAMERAIFHAADWDWPQEDPELSEFIGKDWQKEMKPTGFLKEVVVIRPAILTGGDDIMAKGNYRTSLQELKGAYTISRSEVAHFVVEKVSKHWDDWKGKVINITGK